jgi:hypothetical protein
LHHATEKAASSSHKELVPKGVVSTVRNNRTSKLQHLHFFFDIRKVKSFSIQHWDRQVKHHHEHQSLLWEIQFWPSEALIQPHVVVVQKKLLHSTEKSASLSHKELVPEDVVSSQKQQNW